MACRGTCLSSLIRDAGNNAHLSLFIRLPESCYSVQIFCMTGRATVAILGLVSLPTSPLTSRSHLALGCLLTGKWSILLPTDGASSLGSNSAMGRYMINICPIAFAALGAIVLVLIKPLFMEAVTKTLPVLAWRAVRHTGARKSGNRVIKTLWKRAVGGRSQPRSLTSFWCRADC